VARECCLAVLRVPAAVCLVLLAFPACPVLQAVLEVVYRARPVCPRCLVRPVVQVADFLLLQACRVFLAVREALPDRLDLAVVNPPAVWELRDSVALDSVLRVWWLPRH
jgi:hypothetical protein